MSVIFFCKEFNDHDLGNGKSPLRKKFNAIIKDLEENRCTRLGDTKLISSNVGIKYFRGKLSDSDRLLFTSIKHNDKYAFVILEVILNHDYHKSKFLTKKIKTIEIINKEVSGNASEVEMEDNSQAHWISKFVTFSAKQEDIVKRAGKCELPLVISGAAGSGKTSVALESLRRIKEKFDGGKILYTTKSKNLIKESKKLFECERYDETTGELKTYVSEEIDFLSIHEFFEKIIKKDVERKKPIDRSKFFSWFNGICKKDKFKEYKKDGDKIFEEFTAVIGGGGLLGKDLYVKLGNRQSMFPKDKRDSIYDFFKEYKEFMEKDSEYYDPNLIAHECTVEEIYDAVVVDEVQDLTKSTLGLILKSLKDESKGNFLLCGDVNQVIHPSFFSLSQLQSFFYQNKYLMNHGSEVFYTLKENYRNSEQVIELANRILHLKNYCFASEDKITTDEKEAFFMNSDTKSTGNVSFIADDKKEEIAKKVSKSINWAILVLDNESKEDARKLFDTPLVFNIHEAKGLEFENVILYKFMSCKAYNGIWNIICPNKSKERIENAISEVRDSYNKKDVNTSRNKNNEDKSFEEYKFYMNALYVGASRAIDNVYIMDNEKKHDLLKVIKPEKIVNVDIKKEEFIPEEWRDMALDLIGKGNTEQAKDIAIKLRHEEEKEYAEEIMNELKAKEYHIEAQDLDKDKDKSEQEVSCRKSDTENTSSQFCQNREAKQNRNKNQQKKLKRLEKNKLLMSTICNDEINEFKKIDVSQYDKQQVLELALKNTSLKVAEFLIKDKSFIMKNSSFLTNYLTENAGLNSLYYAASEGHKGVVNLLLDHGAKVNAKAYDNSTPLHSAVQYGYHDIAQLLLDKGADVNAKAYGNFTPLHGAVVNGNEGMVKLLLQYEANVKDKNDKGNTPLHLLTTQSDASASIGKLLLQHGAEVDGRNLGNFTALHAAAEYGCLDLAQLLLENGADINAKNESGHAPLVSALSRGHSKIVDILLADPNINVGCVKGNFAKNEEDHAKFFQKWIQDRDLFDLIEKAVNETGENRLGKLLKEIEELLKSESKYGFKPSLNYSRGDSDENTTIKIVIKAGGEVLQLLYDYAEKNIDVNTEIFKKLKNAKENSQLKGDLCDVSVFRPFDLSKS